MEGSAKPHYGPFLFWSIWTPSVRSGKGPPFRLNFEKRCHWKPPRIPLFLLAYPVISLCSVGQLSPCREWVRILLCVWTEAAVTLESWVMRAGGDMRFCCVRGFVNSSRTQDSNLSATPFNSIIKVSLPLSRLGGLSPMMTEATGDSAGFLFSMC